MAVAQATARAAGPGSAPALLRLPLRLRGAPARPCGGAPPPSLPLRYYNYMKYMKNMKYMKYMK